MTNSARKWMQALALVCIALALAVIAVASSTRTTLIGPGLVYRENLLTGQGRLCGVQGHAVQCVTPPRFSGRPAVA